MPAPWIIAAAGAGLLFVGGSLAAGEVCHTASPGGAGSLLDMLPGSIEDVVGPAPDWLTPSTTAAPTTSSAKFDVKISDSKSIIDTIDAYKSCGVDQGSWVNLAAKDAACLINTGAFVARGEAPPSSSLSAPASQPRSAPSRVCSVEKPVWFWLWIPAALLAAVLALFEYGRRDEHDPFAPVVDYPESDSGDMPEPPVLDQNFRNNTQEN